VDKKILAGIVAGVIIAITIAFVNEISTSSESEIEVTSNDNIGLVINPPTTSVTINQLDEIYTKASTTGIGRSNVYLFWNIIEPEKDQYNWEQSDILMSFHKKNDLKVTLFFSVINGETLGPFPNWIGKPPIQSIQKDRLVSVLDAILSRYDIVDTVIIAGETESQFRYNQQNIPSYKKLFNEVYSELKERYPAVKFGNSFSLHNVLNKDLENVVRELAIGDFVAFSYFPVDSLNDIVKTPQKAREDLEKIPLLVPDKKIALFEVSWSTSEFVGGDDQTQREFVQQVFDFYSENEDDIEFLTWYRVYDKPEGTCVSETSQIAEKKIDVGGGSGLGSSEFVIERLDRYLCNSGLLDLDGKPKPAWNEFVNQIENT